MIGLIQSCPYKLILPVMLVGFLALVGCSQITEEPTVFPTNTDPIYVVSINESIRTKGYDEYYKKGITTASNYFGKIPGVFIYIYDTSGLNIVIEDYCKKVDTYTSDNYQQCVQHESTNGHITKDLQTAQTSGFMTWASNKNGFYSIFFALKDSLGSSPNDDSPAYLAHLAIHEYSHVFQAAQTISGQMQYSELFIEGYAQMIGQYLGQKESYLSFKEAMEGAFFQYNLVDDSTYLNMMNQNFLNLDANLRMPFIYSGGSWAMAYLAYKSIPSICTQSCTQGISALKNYMEQAGGNNHEAIFTTLFPYSSYSEFYSDFYTFISALTSDSAKTWVTQFSQILNLE